MSEPLIPGTIIYRETGMPRFVRITGRKGGPVEEEEEDVEEVMDENEEEEEERIEGEEGIEEIGEEEISVFLGEEKKKEIKKKVLEREEEEGGVPTYEEIEDLIYTKAEIPTHLKEFAKIYGLPTYEMKLLPQKIKTRIHKYEVVYPAIERLVVGPNGELVPVQTTPNRIRYIDNVKVKRRPVPEEYEPVVQIQPNPYHPDLTVGKYVTFVHPEDGEVKGPVIFFDRSGVTVAMKNPGFGSKNYFVPYETTIKIIDPPAKKTEEIVKKMPDIREMREIPADLRLIMVNSYVALIKGLDDSSSQPQPSSKVVEEQMSEQPLVSWENFYGAEFEKWIRTKYLDQFYRELDTASILEEAQKITQSLNDDKILIAEIFEGIKMDKSSTISSVLDQLNEQRDITALQAHIIRVLNQEVLAGYGHWKGETLAAIISTAIEAWKRSHPANLDDTYNMLINVRISTRLNDYEPTTVDRDEFESQYLASLTTLYEKYLSEREEKKAKVTTKKVESVAEIKPAPFGGVDIRAKVESFERVAAASSSLYEYMMKMIGPYIFLSDPLAKYAKFFHAKLVAGKFNIELLGEANLAHFLPELVTNTKIKDEDWKKIFSSLEYLKEIEVNNILDQYVSALNPTARLPTIINRPNPTAIIGSIVKFLQDPRSVCDGGGNRFVVKNGKYVYHPGTKNRVTEPIPYGDLILCYSPDSKKFTCHDTAELSRSFAKGDYINPYTKKPYPEEFVSKIKSREVAVEPQEPEEEKTERLVEEAEKKESKPKIPEKRIPPAIKATKKKTGKYTNKILLYGEPFDIYLLFEYDPKIELTAEDGSRRIINVLKEPTAEKEEVSIIGFDHVPTVSDLGRLKKAKGAIYIVIEANIPFKDQSSITKRLKGKNKDIKDVYYIPISTTDDYEMTVAVQKAINDYEGGVQKQK